MYNVGDLVFDTTIGASVQVLEKIEAWGYVSYRVFNLATGAVYKATGEQLNMDGGTNTYDENYLRYVTLLSKIRNETAGGLLSSLASGVIPLPHQLHVLNRVMENNTIRYILADEVGLGKTIEAGMVIGGADKLGDALVLHEITQHLKLLRFVLRNFKQPFLRHDGKIVISPLGIAFIVGACISKPHEMTDTP